MLVVLIVVVKECIVVSGSDSAIGGGGGVGGLSVLVSLELMSESTMCVCRFWMVFFLLMNRTSWSGGRIMA